MYTDNNTHAKCTKHFNKIRPRMLFLHAQNFVYCFVYCFLELKKECSSSIINVLRRITVAFNYYTLSKYQDYHTSLHSLISFVKA
uniref:Uncharacterized protein n=1 Tax=Octopus bimaculoides TaxID=37653 RepID=A0A0L8H4U0_OCTBM